MAPNALNFRVSSGELHVLEFEQYECRGDNALHILKEMISLAPEAFEGKSGYVSYFDWPPDVNLLGDYDLVFCSTKNHGCPPTFLPFPCPYSVSWPQVGIRDGRGLISQMLAKNEPYKSRKAFWIGANMHHSRIMLQEIAQTFPEILDVEIMDWNRNRPGIRLESKSRYVSLPEHSDYKYLIDCQGGGYSARLRWLIASGRPVFIVDRTPVEHWHEHLIPWHHFIPVKADLSDLLENHGIIEEDSGMYESISRNAKSFCFEYFLENEISNNVKFLLKG
jgi:hypothetical protein